MRHAKTKAIRLSALLAAMAMLAVACGEEGGGATASADLSGASLTVGSKEFTEQRILGEITIQVLEDAGAEVSDETGTVGTEVTRKALTSGETDLYWEYTGTGWTSHLGHEATEAPTEPQELFEQVAKEDLEKNGIEWLALSPVNNAYAIATVQTRAEELDVTTLTDYAELASDDPQAASLCAATEFLTRPDGWPGVEKAYGFDLPTSEIAEVDLGIVFTQVPSGEECQFGEVFATDGRIAAQDMVVIEDDKQFFVKYNLALTMRQEILEQYPELEELFTPIAEAMTTEVMRDLNAQVDDEGLPPGQVAQTWLEEEGLIG